MHSPFRILALSENGGHHWEYSQRAAVWLDTLAATGRFTVDHYHDTERIDDALLSGYSLFLQWDYPPYAWNEKATAAFERYITEGKGGWVGFHHASLLGEFDGYPLWQWFSEFLGDITYADYIPTLTQGRVNVEEATHPCMAGVPSSFLVEHEEWYSYNRSPRPKVQVLATVDEATYRPDSPVKMGDHPVVWTNPAVAARNLYVFMGHAPELFDNAAYTTLVRNAIFWAAGQAPWNVGAPE